MLQRLTASCFLLLLFLPNSDVGAAAAETNDPHELYEQRCGKCHEPHGGEFVRQHLRRVGDSVIGRRTGEELRAFLERGHGKLNPDEVDVLVLHLTSILERGAVFREKCRICHDRAVFLARRQLIVRNGRLVGRYSGRDIAMFLERHGRLEEAEVIAIMQMLETQVSTQPESMH